MTHTSASRRPPATSRSASLQGNGAARSRGRLTPRHRLRHVDVRAGASLLPRQRPRPPALTPQTTSDENSVTVQTTPDGLLRWIDDLRARDELIACRSSCLWGNGPGISKALRRGREHRGLDRPYPDVYPVRHVERLGGYVRLHLDDPPLQLTVTTCSRSSPFSVCLPSRRPLTVPNAPAVRLRRRPRDDENRRPARILHLHPRARPNGSRRNRRHEYGTQPDNTSR